MTPSSTRQLAEIRAMAGPRPESGKQRNVQTPAPFSWQSWPIVDEWRSSGPVAATALAITLAIGLTVGKLDLALLALALQALVLWRLWLPIHYEIDDQGIEQRILGRVLRTPWHAIRRCELCRDGVQLFRDAVPRPFDSWRSIYLPWNSHRETVIANLSAHISLPSA